MEKEKAPTEAEANQNNGVNTPNIRNNPLIISAKSFGEEEEEINWLAIARECIVPQGVEIPAPETLFELNGIPIITKCELSLLIAKPKQGKSTVASYIAGRLISEGKRVLVIDTEQGKYYSSRSQSWTLKVSGNISNENLVYLDIKRYTPEERVLIIEEFLKDEDGFDLVIIDGVVDAIYDPNDQKEASTIVNILMKWAVDYGCHILNILHKNKTDTNARGAIGTALQNKCETTIDVSLEGTQIVCSPLYTRNEPFAPFAFTRDSYGMPVLVDGYVMQPSEGTRKRQLKWDDISDLQHRRYLADVFVKGWKPKLGELKDRLSNIYGSALNLEVGDRKVRALLDHLQREGIIAKKGRSGTSSAYYELTEYIESMHPVDSTEFTTGFITGDIDPLF